MVNDQPEQQLPTEQPTARVGAVSPTLAPPQPGHFAFTPLETPAGGWTVGSSIVAELELVLWLLKQGMPVAQFSPAVADLKQRLPDDWKAQWVELDVYRSSRLLIYLAHIAGVVLEADYTRATLTMRDMDAAEVLARLTPQAGDYGTRPNESLVLPARLTDLELRLLLAFYAQVGFGGDMRPDITGQRKSEIELALRLLRGGDLHTRFWHWLDRFYYEVYRPWRQEQTGRMQTLEQRALLALGSQQGSGVPPLAWLPIQNPLRQYTKQATRAVQAGELHVCFWVEPTGMFDAWLLLPGLALVSFAPVGAEFQRFFQHIEDIARRTHALADPTRLAILRLIRQLSLSNTDIANYLEIARPTVSVHAKILREAGLIRTHPEGREVRHTIVPEEVRRLFRDLEAFLDLPPPEEGEQR
ncbi:MAG: metalloregulator ArsR/SmtB family transcription factor [Chloroflexaceae bacterium]|nr:metalloregulator ArsR/SmtB family transcription factor [Chloroflexaceae bacterium]